MRTMPLAIPTSGFVARDAPVLGVSDAGVLVGDGLALSQPLRARLDGLLPPSLDRKEAGRRPEL